MTIPRYNQSSADHTMPDHNGGDPGGVNLFSERLRLLIDEQSTSAFARQVGLSESLIRKYLKGSEPSLSKAWQIARRTNTSLYWLAGAPEPGEPRSNHASSD